jgi:hypothetical protein
MMLVEVFHAPFKQFGGRNKLGRNLFTNDLCHATGMSKKYGERNKQYSCGKHMAVEGQSL